MPPPEIIGRGIQSKLINTETGKRLYASDRPYQEQMQKLAGKYVQDTTLVQQSEFKKPYLESKYPDMEHFQYPGFPEPKFPSGPGAFNKDCEVGYEAAGAIEGWRICAPADDCAGWVFTCAHKIVAFSCGNCQIAKMEQLPNDRLLVVICSKSDALDVKYKTNDGKTNSFRKGRTCLGTNPDPTCVGLSCANCKATPDIGYTTQQMSTSGGGSTQNLNADGGGGGPYTWSIISGGGTLSKLKTTNNEMTVYTAPSSNADCALNPTIQVKDYCGHTKTLKLAVNAVAAGTAAVGEVDINVISAGHACGRLQTYDCTNALICNSGFGAWCNCNPYCPPGPYCACPDGGCITYPASCQGGSETFQTINCGGTILTACTGQTDVRTPTQKSNGCCPAKLL